MNVKVTKLIFVGLVIILVTWLWRCLNVATVIAQSVPLWSDPILLSNPEVDAWAPTIAVDTAGNVHIIWSQTMTLDPPPGEGDTLFYTRWNGTKWTQPVDVLISPGGEAAEWPDVAITPDSMLHVVWGTGGQGSKLFYARAPGCCADRPANWSEPVRLYMPILYSPVIVADEFGRLHVAGSSQETGDIIYLRSEDGGNTWSNPVNLFTGTRQPDEYAIWPRLAVDGQGRVHLVWTTLPYPGRAVVYARSDDGGLTWNQPQVIDTANQGGYISSSYGPIYIDVEARNQDELHLIWDGAPTIERNHIWSLDGGLTWSEPNLLFPEVTLVGRSGWNDMAFTSDNILHAVSMVSVGSPLHATWDGTHWSDTDHVSTTGPATSGTELLDLAISRGNTLHTVWLKKDHQPFTVWYAQGQTSAPELAIQALPMPTLIPEPTATPKTISPTTSAPRLPSTPSPQQPIENKSAGSTLFTNPLVALLASVLPALLLVGITSLAVNWRKNR